MTASLTELICAVALEKAGGYYYSTGGSEAIVRGEIGVKQGEIASFESGQTVVFKDGSREHFDVVVFATGYTGFPDTVRATLGETYVNTFNPVWGLDAEGEIRGVARESNIPNTFFAVGALAGSRMTSKSIALQIMAQRLGVWGERCRLFTHGAGSTLTMQTLGTSSTVLPCIRRPQKPPHSC
jgi:hypothetical protein